MKKFINIKNIAILTAALLVTGCDNNSEDDNTILEEVVTVNTISGVIIDGYIANASVCLDINNNDNCDSDEPTTITNNQGVYSLDIKNISEEAKKTVKVIAMGGIDTFSNKPFNNILKSNLITQETNINLNGVTTFIAEYSSNANYEENKRKISNLLNINEKNINTNILTLEDKSMFKESLKIQKMLDILNLGITNEAEKIQVRKTLAINLFEQNLNTNSLVDSLTDDKFLILKYKIKEELDKIDKNNSSTFEEMVQLQQQIEQRISIIEVNEEGSIDNILYQENLDFINTLQNTNVNLFLKRIGFRIILEDVLFASDKIFLENLNMMNLTSDTPTISELETEMRSVGLTDREIKLIIRLNSVNNSNE